MENRCYSSTIDGGRDPGEGLRTGTDEGDSRTSRRKVNISSENGLLLFLSEEETTTRVPKESTEKQVEERFDEVRGSGRAGSQDGDGRRTREESPLTLVSECTNTIKVNSEADDWSTITVISRSPVNMYRTVKQKVENNAKEMEIINRKIRPSSNGNSRTPSVFHIRSSRNENDSPTEERNQNLLGNGISGIVHLEISAGRRPLFEQCMKERENLKWEKKGPKRKSASSSKNSLHICSPQTTKDTNIFKWKKSRSSCCSKSKEEQRTGKKKPHSVQERKSKDSNCFATNRNTDFSSSSSGKTTRNSRKCEASVSLRKGPSTPIRKQGKQSSDGGKALAGSPKRACCASAPPRAGIPTKSEALNVRKNSRPRKPLFVKKTLPGHKETPELKISEPSLQRGHILLMTESADVGVGSELPRCISKSSVSSSTTDETDGVALNTPRDSTDKKSKPSSDPVGDQSHTTSGDSASMRKDSSSLEKEFVERMAGKMLFNASSEKVFHTLFKGNLLRECSETYRADGVSERKASDAECKATDAERKATDELGSKSGSARYLIVSPLNENEFRVTITNTSPKERVPAPEPVEKKAGAAPASNEKAASDTTTAARRNHLKTLRFVTGMMHSLSAVLNREMGREMQKPVWRRHPTRENDPVSEVADALSYNELRMGYQLLQACLLLNRYHRLMLGEPPPVEQNCPPPEEHSINEWWNVLDPKLGKRMLSRGKKTSRTSSIVEKSRTCEGTSSGPNEASEARDPSSSDASIELLGEVNNRVLGEDTNEVLDEVANEVLGEVPNEVQVIELKRVASRLPGIVPLSAPSRTPSGSLGRVRNGKRNVVTNREPSAALRKYLDLETIKEPNETPSRVSKRDPDVALRKEPSEEESAELSEEPNEISSGGSRVVPNEALRKELSEILSRTPSVELRKDLDVQTDVEPRGTLNKLSRRDADVVLKKEPGEGPLVKPSEEESAELSEEPNEILSGGSRVVPNEALRKDPEEENPNEVLSKGLRVVPSEALTEKPSERQSGGPGVALIEAVIKKLDEILRGGPTVVPSQALGKTPEEELSEERSVRTSEKPLWEPKSAPSEEPVETSSILPRPEATLEGRERKERVKINNRTSGKEKCRKAFEPSKLSIIITHKVIEGLSKRPVKRETEPVPGTVGGKCEQTNESICECQSSSTRPCRHLNKDGWNMVDRRKVSNTLESNFSKSLVTDSPSNRHILTLAIFNAFVGTMITIPVFIFARLVVKFFLG